MPECGHLLCELIGGGACEISAGRSRGCSRPLVERSIDPALLDEVRELLAVLTADTPPRTAAVRLAEIFRREAREDRHLLAQLRDEDPDLAPALARLCLRRA